MKLVLLYRKYQHNLLNKLTHRLNYEPNTWHKRCRSRSEQKNLSFGGYSARKDRDGSVFSVYYLRLRN